MNRCQNCGNLTDVVRKCKGCGRDYCEACGAVEAEGCRVCLFDKYERELQLLREPCGKKDT